MSTTSTRWVLRWKAFARDAAAAFAADEPVCDDPTCDCGPSAGPFAVRTS